MLSHEKHVALDITARACLDATVVLENAARVRSGAARALEKPVLCATVLSSASLCSGSVHGCARVTTSIHNTTAV